MTREALISRAEEVVHTIVAAVPMLQHSAGLHFQTMLSILQRTAPLIEGPDNADPRGNAVSCWALAAFWIAVKWHEAHLELSLDDLIMPTFGKDLQDPFRDNFDEMHERRAEILRWEMRCLAAVGFALVTTQPSAATQK